MGLSTTFLAGMDAVANFGGAMDVMDGSYDTEVDIDETTSLNSRGFYQGKATVKKWTGSLDCVYTGENPPTFNEGDELDGCSISIPGGPSVTGKVIIQKMTYKSVTPKGAVKYSFSFVGTGQYTKG